MVNLETLLSPSGGYNYENTVNTSATGLALGLVMDRGLYERFIGKPLLKDYYRETRPEYTRKTKGLGPLAQPGGIEGAINRAKGRLAQPQPATVVGKYGRTATFNFGLSPEEILKTESQIESLEKAKKKLKVDRKSTGRKLKDKLRADKRFVRGAAWTMLVSFGLDMAIEGFTPGISKVAAQRDEQAMGYSNPLDSPASYTMRQRAVMAIHDSMMSVRNVMGNEAQFMHR